MNIKQPIGLLGGTFDPVHIGHLRGAIEVCEQFNLAHVRLIPCKQPVYRTPDGKTQANANCEQRLHMLKLAIQDCAQLQIDTREITRQTPSYSVETLSSLREEFPQTPLCFILGSDTFATLTSWHRWQEILCLSHLIILMRPGAELPQQGPLSELLAQHLCQENDALRQSVAGQIALCENTPLSISSSAIRARLQTGKNVQFLLPDSVIRFIQEQILYDLSC